MSDLQETQTKPPVILAVDDDLTTRMLICESLRKEGFCVHEADDGAKGLELYREVNPDLVLLDVVMPNMNGFDACAEIRKLPNGGDRVPILMATGLDDVDSIHRAYEVGATDFITKPFNWALLGHRVRYMVRAGHTFDDLRRTMMRNRALLDAIPDGMIRFRSDGIILESKFAPNSPFAPNGENLRGQHIDDVVPGDYVARAKKTRAVPPGKHETEIVEFQDKDPNSARDFEARVVVSGDNEMLMLIRDITRRKKMELELRASEKRFRSLIENASDLITLVSKDGTIVYESPAVSRMLGYDGDTLLGENLYRLIHEDDVAPMRECIETAFRDPDRPGRHLQVRMSREEGGQKVMETVCKGHEDGSGMPVVVINSRDITDRIEAQKALKNSEEQLRQSQKMEAIGRLAGGVAHDFNNLLTAILGYGQLVEDRLLSEGMPVDEAQEIRKAATRATSLTRQLLAFSRKQVMQTKVLNLNNVVQDIHKMLHRLLGEDVELLTLTDPTLNKVNVDPGQMEQVMLNLAVNARDAMPSGGTLTIETKNFYADPAFLASHAGVDEGAYILLSVADTGTGMDDEIKSRIFEPFFTTKEEGKGTGLGLATVYGIVNQSSGHIWVDSTVGVGTTFNIIVPVSEQEAQQVEQKTDAPRSFEGNETILLVEDEDWVRSLVKKCLERQGYTVITAEDGRHGMNVAENFKGTIDLMLTDVVMPQMNGVDLAQALSPRRPDMRVVFMSGYTDHALLESAAVDLEKSFLQKPFTLEAVAQKLRDALDRPAIPLPNATSG